MKTPASYSVGLRPDARPDFTADRVVPRINPDAKPVQQFGEAMGEVGLGVLRINEVLAERVDRAKATEADAKIADAYRELLTGPKGYQTQLGRGAIDSREDVLKSLDEQRQTILGALTASQRQLLAESDAARYRHAREHVDSHYTRQLSVYEEGQIEARSEGLMQDAVTAAVSPLVTVRQEGEGDEFTEKRNALRGSLAELATRRGYSDEQRQQLLDSADANVAAAVVGQLVSSGRALDAAEFLNTYGGEEKLTAASRSGLRSALQAMRKTIEDGGIKEQAQTIMRDLVDSGAPLTEQLKQLDAMHASGLPIEVRDAAETRVLERARILSDARDTAGKDALARAKVWKAQNPAAELPPEDRERLRQLGVDALYDLHVATDGNYSVRPAGLRVQRMTTDEMLAEFPNADALERALTGNLPAADTTVQVLRYKKAKGEALSPAEAFAVDKADVTFRFLDGKQYYAQKLPKERIDRDAKLLEAAVVARMNELARATPALKDSPMLARTMALEDVWSNGGSVNGRWVPSALQTPEETAAVAIKTASGRTVTFSEAGGQVVPSTAFRADGTRVAFAAPEADYIPTAAEIAEDMAAEFKAKGINRSPTQPEIAEKLAGYLSANEARKREATEAANLENRLLAGAVIANLRADIERGVGDQLWKLRKEANRPTEWLQARSTADAQRAAREKSLRAQALRASADAVVAKHRELFAAVGLSPADALQLGLPPEMFDATGYGPQPQTDRGMRAMAGYGPSDTRPAPKPVTLTDEQRKRLEDLRARYAPTQAPPK